MIMKICRIVLTLALASLAVAGAIPKEHKNRVVDKELSDEKHFDGDEEHNPQYDHEAFLGKEEAKRFHDLTPEESKERLGKIYEKIDTDSDGKVSEAELKVWIKRIQNMYLVDDTERQWKEFEISAEGLLTWDQYKKKTYGSLEIAYVDTRDIKPKSEQDTPDDESQYAEMVKRDERRWKRADKNQDGKLNKEEFSDFLHPEERPYMKDIVIEETLEDIDKNGDRKISLEEYIGDFHLEDGEDEPEPEWSAQERKSFQDVHDKNKDGVLDETEIIAWIIPDDYDHTAAESKHLMGETDQNKDGFLTLREVLDKYDLFVGSQVTDFGEVLARHDEF